jgi:hypothetical protein
MGAKLPYILGISEKGGGEGLEMNYLELGYEDDETSLPKSCCIAPRGIAPPIVNIFLSDETSKTGGLV